VSCQSYTQNDLGCFAEDEWKDNTRIQLSAKNRAQLAAALHAKAQLSKEVLSGYIGFNNGSFDEYDALCELLVEDTTKQQPKKRPSKRETKDAIRNQKKTKKAKK
jgi:hypothetical protein